ncbi:hypothetical protein ISCGN_013295 [Ixodes scapularis]
MGPFLEHTRSRRGTSVISLELAIAILSLKLVPGERLCPGCKVRCFQMDVRFKQTTDKLTEEITSSEISKQEGAFPSSLSLKFTAVWEIPLSMGQKHGKTNTDMQTMLDSRSRNVSNLTNTADVNASSTSRPTPTYEFRTGDYRRLMEDVQRRFDEERDRSKKISLLTLAPSSWSRKRIAQYFGASERQVRLAMSMKKENGILSCSTKRVNRPLDESTKRSVRNFYEDELVSICIRGKNDVVRGRQKRLLLMNLKEAYEE